MTGGVRTNVERNYGEKKPIVLDSPEQRRKKYLPITSIRDKKKRKKSYRQKQRDEKFLMAHR